MYSYKCKKCKYVEFCYNFKILFFEYFQGYSYVTVRSITWEFLKSNVESCCKNICKSREL